MWARGGEGTARLVSIYERLAARRPAGLSNMDPQTFIIISQALLELTKAKHCVDLLPPEALSVFSRLKVAYDGKDIKSLGRCFAENYKGDFYGAESKGELLAVFGDLFGQFPFFMSPDLTIVVHGVGEQSRKTFEAIVSFNARSALGGWPIPYADFATGRVVCRIEPCGNGPAMWLITKLDHDEEDE